MIDGLKLEYSAKGGGEKASIIRERRAGENVPAEGGSGSESNTENGGAGQARNKTINYNQFENKNVMLSQYFPCYK